MSVWQYLKPDILDDAQPFIKSEYDDDDFELTSTSASSPPRPPSVPPLTELAFRTSTPVAISPKTYNNLHRQTQHARSELSTQTSSTSPVINNNSIKHNHGLPRTGTTPAVQNESLEQSTSLRTFNSPQELATHYGIPQFLPPVPRTTPKTVTTTVESSTSLATDFTSMKSNYLSMLSDTPEDHTSSNMSVLKSPEETAMDEFLEQLVSPQFRDAASFEEFMTSPLMSTPLLDFTSPNDESPLVDFLTTPVLADEPLIDVNDGLDMNLLYGAMPLFGGFTPADEQQVDKPKEVSISPEKMHLMTPTTPALDSMSVDPTSVYPSPQLNMSSFAPISKPTAPSSSSSTPSSSAIPVTTTLSARRAGVTGTRRNITPNDLLPEDAPTQTRKYTTPSVTSRKEVPAVFDRKRKRAVNDDDEEDELTNEPLPPNATEREQIEWKRRQNTLAARKSRKRKLEHQQWLESRVENLERDVEVWRTRTQTLQSILKSHGIPVAEFPPIAQV